MGIRLWEWEGMGSKSHSRTSVLQIQRVAINLPSYCSISGVLRRALLGGNTERSTACIQAFEFSCYRCKIKVLYLLDEARNLGCLENQRLVHLTICVNIKQWHSQLLG